MMSTARMAARSTSERLIAIVSPVL